MINLTQLEEEKVALKRELAIETWRAFVFMKDLVSRSGGFSKLMADYYFCRLAVSDAIGFEFADTQLKISDLRIDFLGYEQIWLPKLLLSTGHQDKLRGEFYFVQWLLFMAIMVYISELMIFKIIKNIKK